MPETAVHIAHVSRANILTDVSLDIVAGETFALVGANGAGKSTLIKGLLDLARFDKGEVRLFGSDSRTPQARARVSYLPERFNPPHYLAGGQFLDYMLGLQGVACERGPVAAVLASLELPISVLDRSVRLYSKGMAQKLGLAACFLSGKDLLILDEPMSGLDPLARARVKEMIRGYREQGKTVFFSSHMLADVEELADSMAILHQGEVRFTGSPSECRAEFSAATLEQAYLAAIAAAPRAAAG